MGLDTGTTLKNLCGLLHTKFENPKEVCMIELGNQHIGGAFRDTSKNYFSSIVKKHISIDLNGEDGALALDLNSEIKGVEQGDIVTNYGTSEHVSDQYECFKNMHNLCKTGGIIINFVPPAGYWPGHCPYYYNLEYFKVLGEKNCYKIIENKIFTEPPYTGALTMISCVFQKIDDSVFINKSEFDKEISPLLVMG